MSKTKKKTIGNKKVRVNITVDGELLDEAKEKLEMFGGKLSGLFNSYLKDFVTTMNKKYDSSQSMTEKKIAELEKEIRKLKNK
jgi:hypothetical protein